MFAFRRNFFLSACAALILLGTPDIRAAEMRPVFTSGNGRLVMTILSEGYRLEEREQFFQDATNLVDSFFAAEPFREYKDYFNAAALFVASAQSGSDHPGYPQARDTYFNSGYDAADRVIRIPTGADGMGKVNALLHGATNTTDLPVLLVNDLVYGGSGGSLLVVSKSASSPEILIHESGHTLAGLGDEYTDASTFVPTTEPPNTTRQTVRSRIKWNAWVSTNTPIPTPATAEYASVIGLFEGAQNKITGWYRPKLECRMRSLSAPFCEVCREALVKSIYQKVRLASGFSPAELSRTVRNHDPLLFEVDLFQPASHLIEIQWFFDGMKIADATNSSLTLDSDLWGKGTHLVRAELRDPTDWVRNDPAHLLHQSLTWQMEKPFPETVLPTVTIASPPSNARVSSPSVTVTGTAQDNVAVEQVFYQVNDGPFLPASGTSSWNFPAELRPGPNTVRVKCVDISGNESVSKSRVLNYVSLSPLHLILQGQGTVTGARDGQLLEVGRAYRVTARAAAGNLFQGWVGGIVASNSWATDSATFTFTMESNLQLQATFVPNPYLVAQGEYIGFFQSAGTNDDSSGLIRFKLRNSGAFSGKVSTLDADYSFAGKFDASRVADALVKRVGQSSWSLRMMLNEDGNVVGIEQGDVPVLEARPAKGNTYWNAKNLCLALPGRVDDLSSSGDSIATGKTTATSLRMTGTLTDGLAFTQSVPWVEEGWPLFWRARGVSIAMGWVGLGTNSPFAGEIKYFKRPSGGFYPAGLTHQSALVTSWFEPPSSSASPALQFTRGELVLEGGNLSEPLRVGLLPTMGLVPDQTSGVALRFVPRTGRLSGSFLHPLTGKASVFNTVVLQNQTNVAGFFTGTNQTGRVSLTVLE